MNLSMDRGKARQGTNIRTTVGEGSPCRLLCSPAEELVFPPVLFVPAAIANLHKILRDLTLPCLPSGYVRHYL